MKTSQAALVLRRSAADYGVTDWDSSHSLGASLTTAERHVVTQARLHSIAAEAMKEKIRIGELLAEETFYHTAVTFKRGAARLLSLKDCPGNPELAHYMEGFLGQDIPILADTLNRFQVVGNHQIARYSLRPLDLTAPEEPLILPPPRRRGLKGLLLGD